MLRREANSVRRRRRRGLRGQGLPCSEGGGRLQSEASRWKATRQSHHRREDDGCAFEQGSHRCEGPSQPAHATRPLSFTEGRRAWNRGLKPIHQSGCGGKHGMTSTAKQAGCGSCSRSSGKLAGYMSCGSGRRIEELVHSLRLLIQEMMTDSTSTCILCFQTGPFKCRSQPMVGPAAAPRDGRYE